MTTEEINKAGWEYVNESIDETTEIPKNIELIKASAIVDFIEGAKFVNKHWQEKTKWRSLEKEPPTTFGERVQILLKNKHGELSLAPVYSDRSIEDYLDCGFIEWKEIE